MLCCFRFKNRYKCNYCNAKFTDEKDRNLHQLYCLKRPIYFNSF